MDGRRDHPGRQSALRTDRPQGPGERDNVKHYGAGNGEKLLRYLERVFRPEDAALKDARERSRKAGLPDIQVGPMDALHLEVLARTAGARKAVEIGALGGYSGIAIARALGRGGLLHTFELEPAHAEVARESFRKAGLLDRVRIHVGPALERLPDCEGDAPFDLVFIDADKESYPAYLAWAAQHLRLGGIVLGDNAFAFGEIADGRGAGAVAMREFNEELAQGGRFRATMLPTGEGLAMGVKIR
ncbi:MAG: O-methyltransferase [Planctomycetes bacterium]|nr:O-methyltransferase [Planctomycetota bacterium]